jgi:short-subunit dehydrogenase
LIADPSSSVLILGAFSDIGRALARSYAAAGRSLVLAARYSDRLTRDAEDLRLRHGVRVDLVEFDMLETESHGALFDSLATLPSTVISVVGLLGDQARSASDPAIAEQVMRSNYLAPALMLGEAANRMAQRGSGVIIGISSVAGERGRASNYLYGSAKAGFTQFLSGLRNRLAPLGVHVLTVKPGFVDTRMTQGMKLPQLLTAQPEEVSAAILAAEAKRRDTIYVRPVWYLIMAVIRLVPERIFKRMKL